MLKIISISRANYAGPKQNRLLAALPSADYERLLPNLEEVELPLGAVLYESGGKLGYAYFPTDCIVSLVYVMEDGTSVGIAVTGLEGLVGIALFLGGETMPRRAVVQSAGSCYRLKSALLKKEFDIGGALQHFALRYTQALSAQMAKTIVCNRYHSVEQQLCKWLLLSLDRLPGNERSMMQDLIATMLGVRREELTIAAGSLQSDGLIRYNRGHIEVVDRATLEVRVCECYAAVKKEYDRLLEATNGS